jgi:hypothetical protein
MGVATSGPVEGHEETQPSLELDMIDWVAIPSTEQFILCRLVYQQTMITSLSVVSPNSQRLFHCLFTFLNKEGQLINIRTLKLKLRHI